jgi:anaerobic ribonucleoside-triphosphate reductase activating protein
MNVIEVKQFDVVNGPGIRMSIWTAGCSNACKGCWSMHLWDKNKGTPLQEVLLTIIKAVQHPKVTGISILGGDPFMGFMDSGDITIVNLVKLLACYKKPIWVWTGYKFEDIVDKCNQLNILQELKAIDVIIDGKFELRNKDLNLLYRGSSNQRVIDVNKSINQKQCVLYDI